MAILKLSRPGEKVNQLEEMVVYLNGVIIGSIGNNQSREFEMPEGKHRLQAKIGSEGSKVYKFTIAQPQIKSLVIATNNEANNPEPLVSGSMLDFIIAPLQLLYYFIVGQNRYLTVSELKL